MAIFCYAALAAIASAETPVSISLVIVSEDRPLTDLRDLSFCSFTSNSSSVQSPASI
jgi:hypothetical protein